MIEEDKKDAHPSYKEEDYKIIIDRNAEKMEKHQNQLEILMHQKIYERWEVTRPYPPKWEIAPFLENSKLLKLESYDGCGLPN